MKNKSSRPPGRPVDGYLHIIVKLAFKDLVEYELFRDSTTPRSRVEIVLKEVMKNDKRSAILSINNESISNQSS